MPTSTLNLASHKTRTDHRHTARHSFTSIGDHRETQESAGVVEVKAESWWTLLLRRGAIRERSSSSIASLRKKAQSKSVIASGSWGLIDQ